MTRLGIGVVGVGSIGIRGALAHLSLEDVQGVKAIEAGKHVHFNKTMTTTAAEATDLIERAEAAGVKLVVSPGEMLRPRNRAVRELVQNGILGKVSWAATGAAFGTYHEQEPVRREGKAADVIDPSWYWRKPGGGPLYDMTVYGLHALTGILGLAKSVVALSGIGIRQREFQGSLHECDADDNSLLLLDFGASVFAFVHGTFAGSLTGLGEVNVYGSEGTVEGELHNAAPLEYPSGRRLPHVTDAHGALEEAHVFEDVMQLVDWVRDDVPSVCDAHHARHVIEIIEAAYRSAETRRSQELETTF